MEEVKNNWCVIPNYIWKHPELSLVEKCLLGRIVALSTEKGYCYAGNSYLAEELGKTTGSISNIISKLVDKDFLIRDVTRNKKKEIEQRRLKINEIGIRAVYREEVAYPVDTPIHKKMDTLSIKKWIGIPKKMEERIEYRIDKTIDTYTERKKKAKSNVMTLNEVHLEILNHYNMLFRPNKPTKDDSWVDNANIWLKKYSVEEIKTAITNWHKYPHWSKSEGKVPALVWLFRTKNKSGNTNYIEELISLDLTIPKPKQKHPDAIAFEREWDSI